MKPAIFKNEELAKLGPYHFILFEGLWCLADRKGRLEDRPERIEAEIFPFKFQKVKVDAMLNDLANCPQQFIVRYKKAGQDYIQVANFLEHQYPHVREAESTIPAPDKHSARTSQDRLNPDVLNPESLSSESPILNPEITPSAKAVVSFWKELIEHINNAWSRKKRGAKYLWTGKDFAALKRVVSLYQVWEVMALWDVFIASDDEFARKQGYSVPEFVRQIPRLVDANWMGAAKRYMDKLMPVNESGVAQVNALVASLGKEMPR